jgi:DNA-binding transcriptional ArsR family regulator
MGITKTNLFTSEQNALADLAKALGHPARIAIIQHLLAAKECINSELVIELGLAQATVSQHLQELKKTGIICGNISGNSLCYCIDTENWNKIGASFRSFFDKYPAAEKTNC